LILKRGNARGSKTSECQATLETSEERYAMNADTSLKQVSSDPPRERAFAGIAKTQSLALRIGGMTCGHCPPAIEKAIADLPGVSAVQVNAATKVARIE